jgi:peptidylprolyl isomerase
MAPIKDPENTLIMDTTQGKVVIALRPDLAPKHVERIKQLAREGFYDGIVFHRVIEGFMAQTGCPKGTGTGGSKYPNLPAEFNTEKHVRGVCSMARSQAPNSANSQFFICFDDATFLDKQYTAWGQGDRGHGERRQDQTRRARPEPRQDQVAQGGGGREVARFGPALFADGQTRQVCYKLV